MGRFSHLLLIILKVWVDSLIYIIDYIKSMGRFSHSTIDYIQSMGRFTHLLLIILKEDG